MDAQKLILEQEQLFEQWKSEHHFDAFISDGIVCAPIYAKEKVKVLFVLRDMNCDHEFNLAEELHNNGSGWKTWSNVGR